MPHYSLSKLDIQGILDSNNPLTVTQSHLGSTSKWEYCGKIFTVTKTSSLAPHGRNLMKENGLDKRATLEAFLRYYSEAPWRSERDDESGTETLQF